MLSLSFAQVELQVIGVSITRIRTNVKAARSNWKNESKRSSSFVIRSHFQYFFIDSPFSVFSLSDYARNAEQIWAASKSEERVHYPRTRPFRIHCLDRWLYHISLCGLRTIVNFLQIAYRTIKELCAHNTAVKYLFIAPVPITRSVTW